VRFKTTLSVLVILFTLLAGSLEAQMRMVRPPAGPATNYQLEKIGLEVVIDGQKASCVLKYVIHNPGNAPIEVDFLAPLPGGGTVTGLTLFDGRKEMPGQIYGKDEAFKIYQEIVSRLKDPALLEYAGRDTFRARVFPVPAKGRQTLELNFNYLAPKSDGQVGFEFPLAGPMTSGRTPEQEVHLVVRSAPGLSGLYSPLAGVNIDHQPGRDAVVSYRAEKIPVIDRFQLYFQTESGGPVGGLVLSHKPDSDDDGYFLFLADPVLSRDEKAETAKNVIFALDKSGSMDGKKFDQARAALRFILERLEPRDNFNLVDYNHQVFTWKPELMDMSPENRRSALAYVDNLRSGGSTNIEEALTTAFRMIGDPDQPNYIIFLTDGQPTVGEQNEMRLAELARKANPQSAARLFSFGVGYDVNARLLDRLSGQAGGSSVFVSPDEDLEAKVSSFFSRLTSPVLLRPELASRRPVNRVLPERLPDLFAGQQMAVVGRYPAGGSNTFTLTGLSGDKKEKFQYPVSLATGPVPDGLFIAGLWAQRRIGEIIDQLDLAGGRPNKELVDELVKLSKKYGILTPYTSFLALENQNITRNESLAPLAAENLSIMGETSGRQANAQREFKNQLRLAPPKVSPAAPARPAPVRADDLRKRAADSSAHPAAPPPAPAPLMAGLDSQVARAGAAKLSLPNQWGGQTFFFKDGQWQAENLTEADLKKITTVKQFSEEYFTLAKKLKPEEMVWLTQKEPVLFKYEGRNYLIEPASEAEAG